MRLLTSLTACALLACGSGSSTESSRSSAPTSTPTSERGAVAAPSDPAPSVAQPSGASPPQVVQPLLLELYTSQGCSSCPPADQLLTAMGERGLGALDSEGEQRLIPLSFHVDYWNYIGWTDPYSSARWSQRQRAYAAQLANGRSYTPQLVIHGRAETVGSRRQRVADAIANVRGALDAPPQLELGATRVDSGLQVNARAALSSAQAAGALDAWVVLYQNGVATEVPRGENAGRTLRNSHVVRDMRRAFTVAAQKEAGEGRVAFEIDGDALGTQELGLVLFLQDRQTLQIHGVHELAPEQLRAALGEG